MNLIIDVGNTNVKLAVFQKESIKENYIIKNKSLKSTLKKVLKKYPEINGALLSSVGEFDITTLNDLDLELVKLDFKTKVPFINLYETPETLGVDRIALVSASVKNYPENNVLIIDAGTCITYDFINHKNEYIGGAISPGLEVRYKSLNNLTANLPLLDARIPKKIIGKNTEFSIHSGVVNGILMEIEGVIEEYRQNFKDLTVILTGGDANFLSKQLKSSIFAHSNFLLEGLNYILDYNTK